MIAQLDRLLADESLRRQLAAHGLATVRARHTCAHRVDELLTICDQIPLREMETL
jgi:spore maturation protein CgeB